MSAVYYELELTLTHSDAAPHYAYNFTNRSKNTTGFPLACTRDIVLSHNSIANLPLGVSARLLRITPKAAAPQPVHFWVLPCADMHEQRVMLLPQLTVIPAHQDTELQATVTLLPGSAAATIHTGDTLVQIVAPDIGWIKNVRVLS